MPESRSGMTKKRKDHLDHRRDHSNKSFQHGNIKNPCHKHDGKHDWKNCLDNLNGNRRDGDNIHKKSLTKTTRAGAQTITKKEKDVKKGRENYRTKQDHSSTFQSTTAKFECDMESDDKNGDDDSYKITGEISQIKLDLLIVSDSCLGWAKFAMANKIALFGCVPSCFVG